MYYLHSKSSFPELLIPFPPHMYVVSKPTSFAVEVSRVSIYL